MTQHRTLACALMLVLTVQGHVQARSLAAPSESLDNDIEPDMHAAHDSAQPI